MVSKLKFVNLNFLKRYIITKSSTDDPSGSPLKIGLETPKCSGVMES